MHIVIKKLEFHEYETMKIGRTWMVRQKMCHNMDSTAMPCTSR